MASVKIETITPAKARSWLERNTANRRPREGKIASFIRDMQNGDWHLTGESFKFGKQRGSSDEVLIDGQNRLWAVVRSGVTIEEVVIRGLDYDVVMPVIDSGTARTFTDLLKIKGETDYANLSSAVSGIYRQLHRKMRDSSFAASHSALLDLLYDDYDAIRAATVASTGPGTKGLVRVSCFSAAFYFAAQIDHDAAVSMRSQVASGEGLLRTQPAFALRQWYMNARAATRQPAPLAWAAITNRAFIAELEGRDLSKMTWRTSDQFPYVQDAEVISSY